MSGIGSNGAYGSPANIDGVTATTYPPGPSMWVAGQWLPIRNPQYLTALDLNQQLSAPVAFLNRKPMFQLSQFVAQPVGSGVHTPLTMDTETSDAWNMHADDTDSSQIVVQPGCDGVWLVQGSVPYNTVVNGHYFGAEILYTPLNGAQQIISGSRQAAQGVHLAPTVADLVVASAGDVIQLGGYQTSGTTIDTWASVSANDIARYSGQAAPVITGRWVAADNLLPNGYITVSFAAFWNGPDGVFIDGVVPMESPNLPTWDDTSAVTSAVLNGSVTGPVLFLANVPACRALLTGIAPAVPSGSDTQLTGLETTFDNWAAFNQSTSTWTCPHDGAYLLYGQCGWPQQSSAFTCNTALYVTSGGVTTPYYGASASGTAPAANILRKVRLKQGDTVQVKANQNSRSAVVPNYQTNSRFFSLWLSA